MSESEQIPGGGMAGGDLGGDPPAESGMPSDGPGPDPHQGGETPDPAEEIRRQVEERRLQEEKELAAGQAEEGKPIPSSFIRQCLNSNELGDGALYSAVNKGKHVYIKNSASWYFWNGHHWDVDVMDSCLGAVEDVVDCLLNEYAVIQTEEREALKDGEDKKVTQCKELQQVITKRISKLRSDKGRTSCLKLSHTMREGSLAMVGDEFDADPWLLGCQNGVVDLRTGELRSGRPSDRISKACPHPFVGIDAISDIWEQAYLQQTFEEHPDVIPFLHRLLGYSVSGIINEHVFSILHGQGRNGKSILVETILHVLGPLAAPVQSELLLDQGRNRSAAAPSPEIMALKGRRIVFASETDEDRKFSASRVKWLSGGDRLVGRAPHDKRDIDFQPTHTLFLITNNIPHVNPWDFAFWERVLLIPFTLSFVNRAPVAPNERRADLKLQEKLFAEAPKILSWLVRGCVQWQEKGLNPPDIVRQAIRDYRRDEDLLADFVEANCILGENILCGASELYENFSKWFEENISKKGLSQKRFGKMMRQKGFERIKSGTYKYKGIGLLSE